MIKKSVNKHRYPVEYRGAYYQLVEDAVSNGDFTSCSLCAFYQEGANGGCEGIKGLKKMALLAVPLLAYMTTHM